MLKKVVALVLSAGLIVVSVNAWDRTQDVDECLSKIRNLARRIVNCMEEKDRLQMASKYSEEDSIRTQIYSFPFNRTLKQASNAFDEVGDVIVEIHKEATECQDDKDKDKYGRLIKVNLRSIDKTIQEVQEALNSVYNTFQNGSLENVSDRVKNLVEEDYLAVKRMCEEAIKKYNEKIGPVLQDLTDSIQPASVG